ncbi:hypothetical protein T09_8426 [Trichinella sp. T9]|nr:hypothetical protein T09_8426 [Trichinella sp. T9]
MSALRVTECNLKWHRGEVESGGAVSEVGRCSSMISKRLLSMCHHYQRISVMQKPRTQAAISQFCPSVAIFIEYSSRGKILSNLTTPNSKHTLIE